MDGTVMSTTSPSSSTSQPSPSSTSAISGTSRICGQLVMRVVPSARSAAAISFSTLFLAPVTRTSPARRAPPVTRNLSLTGSQPMPGGRYRTDMAVHITRVYTRTGDDGTTGLSAFSRVRKTDLRLVAYADCDAATATIGCAV